MISMRIWFNLRATCSTLYGKEYTSDDDYAGYTSDYRLERWIEFAAALVEVAASFGWFFAWYSEYKVLAENSSGPIPSRGW